MAIKRVGGQEHEKGTIGIGVGDGVCQCAAGVCPKDSRPTGQEGDHDKKTQHKAKKPGYAARRGKNSPAPTGARRSQGFEE